MKYHSELEMMNHGKQELEEDLKTAIESGNFENSNKQHIEQIKARIEHLKDQMKSVVFLLMRYQEGLDYCQELIGNENKNM